jgi:hypothetical protein
LLLVLAIGIGTDIAIGIGIGSRKGRDSVRNEGAHLTVVKSRRRQEVEGESNPTHLRGNPGLYSPYINQENPASSHIAAR